VFWGDSFIQCVMVAYGTLMLFSFSIFFGLGILLARYFKPRGEHRLCRVDRWGDR
jgi:hypothetical protein